MGIANSAFRMPPSAFPYASRADTGVAALMSCMEGASGGGTPLLILKRRVKKMIEEEDTCHPLTDEHITERLQAEGIQVTRRTVAKYREQLGILSSSKRKQLF